MKARFGPAYADKEIVAKEAVEVSIPSHLRELVKPSRLKGSTAALTPNQYWSVCQLAIKMPQKFEGAQKSSTSDRFTPVPKRTR